MANEYGHMWRCICTAAQRMKELHVKKHKKDLIEQLTTDQTGFKELDHQRLLIYFFL